MPRYVLLRHELPPYSGRESHWDFMLEHEGVLWTWAVEKLPAIWLGQLGLTDEVASEEVLSRRLTDHRLQYLTYEGEVSEGRGTVTQVAAGEFDLCGGTESPIEVELRGTLSGKVRLARRSANATEWLLSSSPLPDGNS